MYPPPPPYEHRPAQPKHRQRFRPLWLSLIGCAALLAVGIGALCALGAPAFMQGYRNGQATSTAESRATALATPSSQSHNRPHMGGVLDDFVAMYGLPTKTAPDNEMFTTSDKVQITAYVNKAQMVNQIYISGLSTWNFYTTLAYCKPFLPADAVASTNAVGDRVWIDYNSSMGQIVMQLQTPTCLLFISPS